MLDHRLKLGEFIQKFEDNNVNLQVRHENGPNELMVFSCELVNGVNLISEVIFDKTTNAVNMQLTGQNETYLAYFHHALSIIANL